MSTIIFLGPTLAHEAARQRLSATYLPPASQGDVLRALQGGATRIGIIDGYFNHVPSVWHKEILLALEQGVPVYGAASMGALRAAELHGFGMQGVGRVFEWYRDGALTDDDEVAVVHGSGEDGYRQLSEALVNVREHLSAAVSSESVTASFAASLFAIAQGLFYRERSYPRLFALAREQHLLEREIEAFAAFIKLRTPVKQRDAIALLERMAADTPQPTPALPRFTLERTFFLERLRNHVALEQLSQPSVPAPSGLAPAALNTLRKKTLLRTLAMKHASQLGLLADADETQQMADDFRRARGLVDGERMLAWLKEQELSLEAFSEVIRELATVRKLEHHYSLEVDARIGAHVRMGLG